MNNNSILEEQKMIRKREREKRIETKEKYTRQKHVYIILIADINYRQAS